MKDKTAPRVPLRDELYQAFIRKIFFRTIALFLCAVAIVLFLRGLTRGHVGNSITRFLTPFFGWDRSLELYHLYIRNNLQNILIVLIVLIFVVLFRMALHWFMRYFDEISAGVDRLAEENSRPISMSPELSFMEEELNRVRVRLEERAREAKEAEQRKNDLVVYLAHDIRTPLTSVIGYLNLLEEAPNMSVEQRQKYIGIALEKASRLETLINEFFAITRYNLQSVPLKKQRTDLYYMLVQVVDEAYPLLSESGKTIKIDADESAEVYGDPDELARVFQNLLRNAVFYGDAGSEILVFARTDAHRTTVGFENAGTIPADKIGSILKNFIALTMRDLPPQAVRASAWPSRMISLNCTGAA